MSTNDAKLAYLRIHASNFLARDQLPERAEILKDALKGILDSAKGDPSTIMSTTKISNLEKHTSTCKFAVTAMTAANLSKPVMLRGYPARSTPFKCTLLEALLATLSDAQMLPPVAIGNNGISEFFVATTTGRCNPTEALLEEIPSIFQSQATSVIVSIGSGRMKPVSLNGQGDFANAVLDLAKSCHAVSQNLQSRFSGHPGLFSYPTRAYLAQEDIRAHLDELIHSLRFRPKRLDAGQISVLHPGILERINSTLNSVLSAEDSRILEKLNVSSDAPFAALVSADIQRNSCTPGTRIAILQRFLDWATTIEPEFKNSLFWLYGLAGTGKTTILRDICERLQKLNLLASSYFCSIQLSSGDSRHIVPTITRHLASRSPAFKTALVSQLQQDPDLFSSTLRPQFEYLLCQPWKIAAHENVGCAAKVVIIDALDECDRGEEFLSLLLDAIDEGQLGGIQFIVSSRPVPRLLRKIRAMRPDSPQVSLHEVPKEEVNGDIRLYLETNLMLPSPRINELVARADGLFIYASTLVKYLAPSQPLAPIELERRLDKVLAQKPERSSINLLYKQIVDAALSLDDKEATSIRWTILHAILCAAEPPSANVVAGLLGADLQVVTAVVDSLYSVLFMDGKGGLIYIFHASFHDFIVSGIDGEFRCHPRRTHAALAQGCLEQMSKSLRFNICHLESSFIPDSDLDPPLSVRIPRYVGDFLVYASRNWPVHLKGSDENSRLNILPQVERVLQAKGIFWIEIMSLLENTRRCKEMLTELLSTSSGIQLIPALRQLALQTAKLVSLFDTIPMKITSHLYLSCLALAEETPERNYWSRQFSSLPHVVSRQLIGTQYCQLIFNVNVSVNAVALSRDGKRIVSGSSLFGNNPRFTQVHIWDVEAGKRLWRLEGHTFSVLSVAFSPDGKRVASGSSDRTFRLWDAESGKQLWLFDDHTHDVTSVLFSPDGKRIASGSKDQTVGIWDTESWRLLHKLKGHTDPVLCVAFSPDGTRIVSGLKHSTICIWDVDSGTQLRSLGYMTTFHSVTFSPNGKHILSSSDDKTIRVWDAKSGKHLHKLAGHTDSVLSVAYSPDGKRILSGSDDKTVRIWDAKSWKQLCKLEGHTSYVNSVAFFPDGKRFVSGSYDGTVRVWDPESMQQFHKLEGHTNNVASAAFSPDGKRVVSGSRDKTVRIWDSELGKQLWKLESHTSYVGPVAFSPNGKHVASGSWDKTIRIWDADSGNQLYEFKGHSDGVKSVAFSPDGRHIISGSQDKTVCIWCVESRKLLRKLEGHTDSVGSVAFSPNGRCTVSVSRDKPIRIWDAETGTQLHQLEGHTNVVLSVAFSPNGKRIVSGSSDNTVRIWDVESENQLRKIETGEIFTNSVTFSPDGKRIVLGLSDASIRIWDAELKHQLRQLEGHTGSVKSVAFSLDGKRIVSASQDKSIRIWDADSGEQSQKLSERMDFVRSIVFPPDTRRVPPARCISTPEFSMQVDSSQQRHST
ncbi:WD40-repeat-containing domain protein [Flagelloscypha sp. PMI_526]|nr:WD40-repeat-containing domain protein [Flagelloscypha sp. PMI_526]